MSRTFLDNLAPTRKSASLKKPLIVSTVIVLAMVLALWYWLDKTQTQAAEEAYASAEDFIVRGNYDQALSMLDKALQHQQKALYFYIKFKVLSAQENYYEAGINLDKAVQHDPANAGYLYEAGYFYANGGGQGQKGLGYLKQAMEREPQNSDYQLAYGTTLAQLGRFGEGIGVLERLAQEDPNYDAVWNELALLYSESNQPAKALVTRLKAVKKFPDDAYHWFWLANTYDRQGSKAKAVAAYTKSIVLAPESGTNAAYRIAALGGKPVPERYREIVEDSIPVTYHNTHAYIRATVSGSPGLFLFDTGASDTILYDRFIRKHHFVVGKDNPRTQYETVGSGIVSAPVLYADVKIGRFSLGNIRVAVIPSSKLDPESDGIIGMNVLKNFNVKMDNLNGTLIFSRR